MNKRILTVATCLAVGLSTAFAQEIVEDKNNEMEEKVDVVNTQTTGTLNKMEYGAWFNHVAGSASNLGVRYTRITNATLFPDTLVYQLYGAAGGGTELGKTSWLSVGEVFYPADSSVFVENPADGIPANFSRFNPYVVDSISIIWRYGHKVPGSVDTLLVHFYNDDKISRYALANNQRAVATVGYSKANNAGLDPTYEMVILLNEEDTSIWSDNADYNGMTIAVPNGGLNVPAGGLAAYTISFIPGYDYSEGDTIEFDWEGGAPDKKLNHFITPTYHDNDKVMDAFRSYGQGLKAIAASRYTSTVWNNLYIPGGAWNDYDEHQYMSYHAVTQNFGVPIVEKVPLAVYPNPVTHNSKLYVSPEVSQDYQQFELMDQSGRVIAVFDRAESAEGVELNVAPGVYFVKFIGQNSVITNRLVVE